jgi:hypothetical protein
MGPVASWLTLGPALGAGFGVVTGTLILLVGGTIGDAVMLGILGGLVAWVNAAGSVFAARFTARGRPRLTVDFRPSKALARKHLQLAMAWGSAAGGAFGLVAGTGMLVARGPVAGMLAGAVCALGAGAVGALVGGVVSAMTADLDSGASLTPLSSWRANRRSGLMIGLIGGGIAAAGSGLAVSMIASHYVSPANAAAAGLWTAATVAATGMLSRVLLDAILYPVALSSLLLAIRWRGPVRLLRFLDDAHRRGVLRAVGPSYQFRHATLQDRLAAPPAGTRAADD